MAELGAQRLERDSFGEIAVPAARLWGAETERARHHFSACEERVPRELLHALALIKAATARANADLGLLASPKAEAIACAAEEILAGRHAQEFPLALWQSGSGTQTHMNVNEVLANRASCLLGGECGQARLVDPHDEVNLGQSTNDVMPSAMNIAAVLSVRALLPVLARLQQTLAGHAQAHATLVKIGRTHLQDATPLTLGQEISGWCTQVADAAARIDAATGPVRALALGGTAVGTGLNAHPALAELAIRQLARVTGERFVPSRNRYAAQASHDDLVALHGALRALAVALTKVANDVRWLASGPRCGLGELALPDNEPGSSIMPGKVNPSQCEALVMACCQVCGNDVALGMAGAGGHFELNACKPVIAFNLLFSLRLLTHVVSDFERHAIRGMQPRPARIAELLERSLMLVTALTPRIGYARAAAIARHAHETGSSLREAALDSGAMSAAEFDAWVRPAAMVGQDDRSDTRGTDG